MKLLNKIILLILLGGLPLIDVIAQPGFSVSYTNSTPVPYERNATTNFYVQTHLNGVANIGCDFRISLNHLPVTTPTDVFIKIKEKAEYGGNVVYNAQYTTSANGGVITSSIDPIALNLSGIYEVEVYSLTGTLLTQVPDYYIFFEKVNTISIGGASFSFAIRYTDAFFKQTINGKLVNKTDFLTALENSIRESWQKIVIDYNLGRPSTNGNFDIYLHCNRDLAGTPPFFHNSDKYPARTDPSNDNKDFFIDTKIFEELNASAITQQELLYVIFSHEFWHSIQWSIMSWDNLKAKYSGALLAVEKEKRDWLIEGQALFLQTKFMETYSTSSVNCNYQRGTADGAYDAYAAIFLNEAFNSTYLFKSLHQQNYFYGLFWRHLYEHNAKSASDADKLKILPTSCQQLEAYNTSDLSMANKLMDNALATAAGNFTTFASALKDFAERAYFHDAAYQNWDDPNKNNFYTAISNYTETAETFNGTLFNKQYKINNSYAFRSHKIGFSKAGAVNVKFTSIATGGSMANFYAKVYVADNSKIYESREITLTNGTGNAEICVDNTAKKLIVLVTRLDANEGQYPDYKITVTPLNLAFTAAVKSTNLPFEVTFANTSTSNMLGYAWDFGDGEKSDEKSPTHVYKNTNAYDVTLNYKGCSAGLALQKKAYITFLPYIEKVEIRKTNEVTNAFEFKREFKTDKFQFSIGIANNFKNSADLLVKVTTSGKLQNMQLTVADGKGASVFSSNSTIPIPSNNKIWEFLIPATSLKQGIHLVSISSADVANNKLLCDPEFQSIPYKVDELTSTWSPNSGITGIDKNYYFYIEPTQPPKSDIQILTENECGSTNYKRKATFINNSDKNFTIDFGDGSSDSLGPYSVKIHYYSKDINTAIIKTLNSVYQEIVTSRLIKF